MSSITGQYQVKVSETFADNKISKEVEIINPLGRTVKIHSDSELNSFFFNQRQLIHSDPEFAQKFDLVKRNELEQELSNISRIYGQVFLTPGMQLQGESALRAKVGDKSAWFDAMDKLLQISEIDPKIIIEDFPALAAQIAQHNLDSSWKELWGMSFNIDAIVKAQIVRPDVVNAVYALAGYNPESSIKPNVFHAGLLHTFSYLFSNLNTPYGYKRERWIRDTVSKGFGLPEDVWSPYPREGNFMANVAFLIGNVAFRGENLRDRVKNLDMVSPELLNFDYSKLNVKRIKETIPLAGEEAGLEIYTDLVKFPIQPSSPEESTHLLIYSVKDPREKNSKLITAFPVNEKTIDFLLTQPKDKVENISLSYNAIIPGVDQSALQKGTRELII